ncbi:hypothetical protein O3P69_016107 [Scylla paramamosain]|uniref:DDE Tnp4 domain-containing protein n=1 Tax=Scylla paramamosain TaxID=85552 RepID=A0AAW0T9Y1_SCYPA
MCNSYVWRESQLRKQFTDGRFGDSVLLGDSSFPLEPFLMTPVRRPKTTGKRAQLGEKTTDLATLSSLQVDPQPQRFSAAGPAVSPASTITSGPRESLQRCPP